MFKSTAGFDKLLEKATSQLLLETDWASIMSICDLIRQGDISPKYAVSAIVRKMSHENPHVALYALQVIECCVKNCGYPIHEEVITEEFMSFMRDLVKSSTDEQFKTKALEIIRIWGLVFKNSKHFTIAWDTFQVMQAEGYQFPSTSVSDALFQSDSAPEWVEGASCHRCRAAFGLLTRQHHCRACGQVFCGKCSSKSCIIVKFGIEKEVRVCDMCYNKYAPSSNATASEKNSSMSTLKSKLAAGPVNSPLTAQSHVRVPDSEVKKSDAEIKEQEELQLALALSESEAEARKGTKKLSAQEWTGSKLYLPNSNVKVKQEDYIDDADLDPELLRYLNRDYWNQKQDQFSDQPKNEPSLTVLPSVESTINVNVIPSKEEKHSGEEKLDAFVSTLRTQLEIFVNRMKSNSSRGRSIANDSSVQTLFMNTMDMHSKLLNYVQEQEDRRVYFEMLQDKLSQVKDARAALNALREEEKQRQLQEAQAAEAQRQQIMYEKLEVMRQKKQEYLQYQRQLALQRMHEQEREMKLRQERAMMVNVNQPGYFQPSMYPPMMPYGAPAPPQMVSPVRYPNVNPIQHHPQIVSERSQTPADVNNTNFDPSVASNQQLINFD